MHLLENLFGGALLALVYYAVWSYFSRKQEKIHEDTLAAQQFSFNVRDSLRTSQTVLNAAIESGRYDHLLLQFDKVLTKQFLHNQVEYAIKDYVNYHMSERLKTTTLSLSDSNFLLIEIYCNISSDTETPTSSITFSTKTIQHEKSPESEVTSKSSES